MKNCLKTPLSLWLLIFFASRSSGEGTPQLQPLLSDQASIKLINTVPGVISTGFARYNDTSRTKYKMYVHVCNLSEKVYMGFDLNAGIGFNTFDVSVIAIAPNGTIAFPLTAIPKSPGPGYIANKAEAILGPSTLAPGGYNPFVFTPTQLGDYSIEFQIDRLPSSGTSGGRGNSYIHMFDITVGNGAVAKPGRLWSSAWNLSVRSSSNSFNGAFFVYSSDRIVSKISTSGMQPQEFVFSANNTGVSNSNTPAEDRKSVNGNTTYPLYPIFLNNPDISCYPTGSFGTFTAAPSLSGCPGNYCFNVFVSAAGTATLLLDLNGTPGYQAGTSDRLLVANVSPTVRCVPWDGKDGQGNIVNAANVPLTINYESGIIHIPIFDVEENPNGFTVQYVRPTSSEPIGLFWDDSNISGGTSNLITPCTANCHVFTNAIGNGRTINSWWVVADSLFSTTFPLTRSVDANRNIPGTGSANDSAVCASLKTILLKGSFVGVPGVKWSVITGSGTFANDASSTTTYTLSAADASRPFIEIQIASAGDGCTSVTDRIRYTVNSLPDVTTNPKDPFSCVGASVTLTGGGAVNYTWDNGITNGTPFTSTVTRRYTVTGTDSKGCQDTASTLVRVNTTPNDKLNVKGDTACSVPSTDPVFVTVFNAQAGVTYQPRLGSLTGPVLGTATPTATTPALQIPINRTPLAPATSNNSVLITTTLIGCGTDSLDLRANVRINKLPAITSLVTASGPVCLRGTSLVAIANTEAGVTYTVFEENDLRGSVIGNGDTAKLSIVMNNLGSRRIRVEAKVAECGLVVLTSQPIVIVNSGTDVNLVVSVSPDTICVGNPTVLKVEKTQTATQYSIYQGTRLLSGPKAGTGFDVTFEIAGLPIGLDTLTIKAFTPGCGNVDLLTEPIVLVNGPPKDSALVVIGDTICSNADSAYVTLQNTMANVYYQLVFNGNPIGTIKGSPSARDTLILVIPAKNLLVGRNDLQLTGKIGGCTVVTFGKGAIILKNEFPTQDSVSFIGDTICSNSDSAYVKVLNTQAGVRYQAIMNGVLVGSAKLSAADKSTVTLGIQRNRFQLGSNLLRISGFIAGCGRVDYTIDTRVLVNPLPDSALTVDNDTVCNNSAIASIRVNSTKVDETYQAYDQNNVPIGTPVRSTGGVVTLLLPIGANSGQLNPVVSKHALSVLASINGCLNVVLKDTAHVIINQDPDTSLTVTETSPVCLGDTALITVNNTNALVRYSLVYQGGVIAQKIGTNSSLIFEVSPPTEGFHEYTVQTGIAGCSVHSLSDRARVKVNKSPDPNLAVSGTSPICYGQNTTITVSPTDTVSLFQVWDSRSAVSTSIKGNGGALSFVVANLPKGLDTLFVRVFTPGCGWSLLSDTAFIQVNGLPDNITVKVEGSSVCPGQQAFAILSPTDLAVTYSLFINNVPTILKVIGTGGSDTLQIPSGFLTKTENLIRFTSEIAVCQVADVLDKDTVFVLGDPSFKISGDDLLCYGSASTYTTNGMPGALTYQWKVDSALVLAGNGTKSISVQFDTLSATLHVAPVGYYGVCEMSTANFVVSVKAPISGEALFAGKDTVCVGETDTIQIIRQKGVLSYQWLVPSTVDSLRMFASDSASDSLLVRYPVSGFQIIKAIPFSECASAYGDTLSFRVKVFGLPVASANDMTVDRVGNLDPITLDGNGTTLMGTGLADTISYQWYTRQSLNTLIENPTSLTNAKLLTTSKETVVYLGVSHVGGYCPTLDSAIITINFDIDVPNVFSPNDDGTHDTWEIKNITTFYPNTTVDVYNKWGSLIWKSSPGYVAPWDGKRNGEDMPVATYYFVLDKKAGGKPMVGSVTIIR